MVKPLVPKPIELSDGKVRLRRWTNDDAEAMAHGINDPAVLEAIPDLPLPYGLEEARSFIGRTVINWADAEAFHLAIEEMATGQAVGDIGLVRIDWSNSVGEIGYWLAAGARGKGIAAAALRLVTRWAFEDLGLERLELYIDPENHPSRRMAERCGFLQEGVMRSHTPRRGEGRSDSVVYGLLRTDPH